MAKTKLITELKSAEIKRANDGSWFEKMVFNTEGSFEEIVQEVRGIEHLIGEKVTLTITGKQMSINEINPETGEVS